ncbi:Hypothetical protein CINCED_3A017376 [Cinara cedri]|uniref:Uncharacterized protein n=1 Tax=Cinara cedri TaxID=506608 RepID=A0A5E4NK81_9HEMI|nr:Hypothetical protein CINCED_3A017376 [Cinara cedri]
MTRLLHGRKSFSRTKTGELIFQGKKEMVFKLSILMKEILKLKTVLDEFEKDHCRINLTREIFNSINFDAKENIGDNAKKQLIEQLDEQYNIKNKFENILIIYNSGLDDVKHLPTVLQTVQGQLAAQKKLKVAVEKNIETLSKKLKTLVQIN